MACSDHGVSETTCVQKKHRWRDEDVAAILVYFMQGVKDGTFERPNGQEYYRQSAVILNIPGVTGRILFDKMRYLRKLYFDAIRWRKNIGNDLFSQGLCTEETITESLRRKCPQFEILDQIYNKDSSKSQNPEMRNQMCKEHVPIETQKTLEGSNHISGNSIPAREEVVLVEDDISEDLYQSVESTSSSAGPSSPPHKKRKLASEAAESTSSCSYSKLKEMIASLMKQVEKRSVAGEFNLEEQRLKLDEERLKWEIEAENRRMSLELKKLELEEKRMEHEKLMEERKFEYEKEILRLKSEYEIEKMEIKINQIADEEYL